jgi:hypothetical protein
MKLLFILPLTLMLMLITTSCLVLVEKDSGKHKGWYKNTNNPHHPKTTNPGKGKGHDKSKVHHKKH